MTQFLFSYKFCHCFGLLVKAEPLKPEVAKKTLDELSFGSEIRGSFALINYAQSCFHSVACAPTSRRLSCSLCESPKASHPHHSRTASWLRFEFTAPLSVNGIHLARMPLPPPAACVCHSPASTFSMALHRAKPPLAAPQWLSPVELVLSAREGVGEKGGFFPASLP